jgi:HEAT repeat protein
MKPLFVIATVMLLGAAGGANATRTAGATEARWPDRRLPASWAPADSADSLWRQARRAIADENWERAAQLLQNLRARFPRSAYFGDSYYWQAFALYHRGGNSAMRTAVGLLDQQAQTQKGAETVRSGESRTLATRIRGILAQSGDAASAADIARSAAEAATAPGAAASASASTSASASGSAGVRVRGGGGGRAGAGTSAGGRVRGGGGGPATAQASSSGCKSEDDDERVEALNALLQMRSEQALPLLKRVLARRDACSEVLRRKAVFLVSQKGSSEAADVLIDAAKNDPDREVREQAVFWLGQVDSEKSVGLLEQILKTSNDEDLQDKALFALTQPRDGRGQRILRDYASREDASGHLREQAIFWIGQHRSDENAQFLKALFGRTKDEDIQRKILFSTSQMRGFGNDQWLLDQAVNAKNSIEVRKQALFWAGQTGGVDVAKLGALYDKGGDHEFKDQVIFVLSQKRDAAAVDKLIDIAKTEKDRELRKQAVFWLGQSRDPRATRFLQELIEKP